MAKKVSKSKNKKAKNTEKKSSQLDKQKQSDKKSPQVQKPKSDNSFHWDCLVSVKGVDSYGEKVPIYFKRIELLQNTDVYPNYLAKATSPQIEDAKFTLKEGTQAILISNIEDTQIIGLDNDNTALRTRFLKYRVIGIQKLFVDKTKVIFKDEIEPNTLPFNPDNFIKYTTLDPDDFYLPDYYGYGYDYGLDGYNYGWQ